MTIEAVFHKKRLNPRLVCVIGDCLLYANNYDRQYEIGFQLFYYVIYK